MDDDRYITLILGEKILHLLDESGVTEVEKLSALAVARAVVPVSVGSVSSETRKREEEEGGIPD